MQQLENQKPINSLVLSLNGNSLLVPAVALAEVAKYKPLKPIANTPNWVLGVYEWRGVQLPLVSFEIMSGGNISLNKTMQVAILNNLNEKRKRQFFALLLSDLPHPLVVDSNIEAFPKSLNRIELAYVKSGEKILCIPDLKALSALADSIDI